MRYVVILIAVLLSFTAAIAAVSTPPKPQKGFFIGGDVRLSIINGTGNATFGNTTFNFDITKTRYSSYENTGLAWVNRRIWGLAPAVGYRFSPRFALLASYNFNFRKKSEESTSYSYNSLPLIVKSEYQWRQESAELAVLISPFSATRFHAVIGLQVVNLHLDMNSHYSLEEARLNNTERQSDRSKTTSLIIGAEYEWPATKRSNFFISTLYSFAEINDTFFISKESLKFGIGGPMIQFGYRYSLLKPDDDEEEQKTE